MKKIINLFLLTILFSGNLMLISQNCKAQINTVDEYGEEKPVFWFYVSIRITEDKVTRMKKYIVRRLGTRVESGTLAEYDRDLWNNLSKGYKLAIGPFPEYQEAEQAQEFYSITEDKVFTEAIDKSKDVNYFTIRVYRRERSNALEIERIPAAVATGKADEFYELLKTNLDFRQLAIGPFWNYETAEEAKRRYRLQ